MLKAIRKWLSYEYKHPNGGYIYPRPKLNFIYRWLGRHLECALASPDGNSSRTLFFRIFPNVRFSNWSLQKRNMIVISRWKKGDRPKLERFLECLGIYPEW